MPPESEVKQTMVEESVKPDETPVATGNDNEEPSAEEESSQSYFQRLKEIVANLWNTHSFLMMVIIAIIAASIYPPLGATYVYPEYTATWIAVLIIFVLAGLGLKSEELSHAFQRIRFNAFVQAFNFLVDSAIVYGISRGLHSIGALAISLADGMVIASCLPLTINMVLVLTSSSGGDEGAAIFNAAFGNLVGVFLTPALILMYIGVEGDVELTDVFFKLACRVVLPIAVGQLLRNFYKPAVDWQKRNKKILKKVQEGILSFIVYTVFCKTFNSEQDATAVDAIVMIAVVFGILCLLMVLSWNVLGLPFMFRDEPKLRVMGLFGCTHKTVAMGIPLINAIYEDNDKVGLYTLPLLVWHPMQLFIGSSISSKLSLFVENEEGRLHAKESQA